MEETKGTILTEGPGQGAENDDFNHRVWKGLIVALGLAVLTIIEYVIAVGIDNPLIWLMPFAIAKGALIMEYFMHFSSLFEEGEH
ncbi:MAG: cytochrome C oxidase subunit IV family protein [Actinomycetia bacterium]|nr:cytochrome C oxidase subunit IV family protein [Actinomycetes bacterium]MCP4221774.1 cytochrome C oxidase subunit IV family protein [Actinomycetes bacterium]MCP5032696.1 cytochrome C oxidase subunit IV family protein [Actinomycetes bacterium]